MFADISRRQIKINQLFLMFAVLLTPARIRRQNWLRVSWADGRLCGAHTISAQRADVSRIEGVGRREAAGDAKWPEKSYMVLLCRFFFLQPSTSAGREEDVFELYADTAIMYNDDARWFERSRLMWDPFLPFTLQRRTILTELIRPFI